MCGLEKGLTAFTYSAKGRFQKKARCRACESLRVGQFRADNREESNAAAARYRHKGKAALSNARAHAKRGGYTPLLANPDDVLKALETDTCKCCGNLLKRKVVDHDHKTGQLRGVICYGCNRSLSAFDDPKKLEQILTYLGWQ